LHSRLEPDELAETGVSQAVIANPACFERAKEAIMERNWGSSRIRRSLIDDLDRGHYFQQ
jgi:hypothetical protein